MRKKRHYDSSARYALRGFMLHDLDWHCTICGRQYRSESSLVRHLKAKHQRTIDDTVVVLFGRIVRLGGEE